MLGFPFTLTGLVPAVMGLFTNLQARRTLREANTTDNIFENPKVLITEGVFRYSRNPMYLGGIVFSFGLAILLGSLVAFIFPIVLFVLLNSLYIPKEEDQLRTMFGKKYFDYEKRVRRWI